MKGVLVVDKPQGATSFDLVRALRAVLRTKKVGHCGTLDPMATGVMVLCVGKATRLVPYLSAADKVYEATLVFGTTTTTDDAEGEALSTRPVPSLSHAQIEGLLEGFRGAQMQVPPQVSALHVGGERAYVRARRGEVVAIAARPVDVQALTCLAWEAPELRVSTRVSKGTYIRSLARDLGEAVGCGAHLSALRRTRSGAFSLGQAVDGEALIARRLRLESADLISPWLALEGMLPVDLVADEALAFRQGKKLPWQSAWGEARAGTLVRCRDPEGELCGVAECVEIDGEHRLRVRMAMVEP